MIIEKSIVVSLTPKVIPHYESRGYNIPRYKDKKGRMKVKVGTTILVRVEDLSENSKVRLTKICDYCGIKIPNQTYSIILRGRKNGNGFDCCKSCAIEKINEMFKEKTVPIDRSLAENFPHLVSEWMTDKNGKSAWEVYVCSNDVYFWQCPKNKKHIYHMAICKRTVNNLGCPYCRGYRVNETNCLATTHPELLVDWDYENNVVTPHEITYGHSSLINWKCHICKHKWAATPNNRTNNKLGCRKCGIVNRSGEKHPLWKGGITPLHNHLRENLLRQWKKDSMKNSQYRCVITGDKNWSDIHHLYSFNKILKETLELIGLDIRMQMSDYTDEERKILEHSFLEVHKKYGLGVCLRKDVHDLYHGTYGDDNAHDQFEEFKMRYALGEFKDLLNK